MIGNYLITTLPGAFIRPGNFFTAKYKRLNKQVSNTVTPMCGNAVMVM
ncbi:MAG: hypothetical protein H7320_10895 [Ferruginibacter sp.]|nr:hypothetical protein [Ferruginibacter sp.]